MRGFFIDAMCPRFLSNLKQAYQNSEMWDIVRHIEKWDGRHSEIQRFWVLVACSFMLLRSTSPTKLLRGIHWNFFFTIAVVSLVSTTTDSWPRIIQILRVSHSVSLSTWMNEWTSRCYRCYQSLPVNSCFGPCFLTHATTPHMFLSHISFFSETVSAWLLTLASPVGCIVLRPGLLRRSFRCQCCTCAWSIPVLDSGQICHFVLWIWSTPIHHNSSNSKPCNPFLYSPKSWPKHASVLHLHSTYHLASHSPPQIDRFYLSWLGGAGLR